MNLLQIVTNLLASYGYIIVFVGVMLESTGVPFPGETVLLAGAVYAANSHLNIIGVLIASALGAILGDNLGYWVGREYGRKFLEKYGKRFGFNAKREKKIESYFEKYGAFTVFIGRFVSLLRTYAAFFAGVNRMRYPVFLLFNALGGIVWTVIIGLLGYFFGSNITLLEHLISGFGLGLLAIIVVGGLIIFFVVRHRKEHHKPIAD